MKTTVGYQAETAVANYLTANQFQLLDRNWRTKLCEIDIVAKKDDVVYFIEVKYRAGAAQGSGFDYIGPQKLKRLKFAAKIWVQNHDWDGDCRLAAVQVTGLDYGIIELVEIE